MALTRRPVNNAPEPPTAYGKSLPCGRMYENDFAALVRFLREGDRSVEIRAGNAAWLDGAEDLSELQRRERSELRLKVADPPVEIALGSNSRAWTNDVGSVEAKELVDGVASLCRTWRTVTGRVDAVQIVWVLVLGTAAQLLMFVAAMLGDGLGEVDRAAWGIPAVFAACFWGVALLGTGNRIHVSPRSRHAATERRIQVLGTIAISLFSGVVGALATWLLALKN